MGPFLALEQAVVPANRGRRHRTAVFSAYNLVGSFSGRARNGAPVRTIKHDGVTHLPSIFLLLLVPMMPNMELAVAVLLLRHLLSQMDVPTRQSYTWRLWIQRRERAPAAGVLSVARNAGAAVAPLLTGAILATPALGLPFLLAGGLKVVYDLLIYTVFRSVKLPEE